MRVIKFRGKDISQDIWYEGSLYQDEMISSIMFQKDGVDYNMIVDPETVGEFTGLKDKNEKEIYEGDVIELVNDAGEKIRVVCEYGTARRHVMSGGIGIEVDIPCFYFLLSNGKKSFPIVRNYAGKHDLQIFEVIGNIYEK